MDKNLKIVSKNPEVSLDEGTMITWFSNSLMSGWDENERRNIKKIQKLNKRFNKRIKSLQSDIKGLKYFISKTKI